MRLSVRSITLRLVAAIVIVPTVYFTVFRYLDAAICDYAIRRRVESSLPYFGLADYIETNLRPGMEREEVHSVLGRIGRITVVEEIPYRSEVLVGLEDIQISMCFHPLNNPRVFVRYDQDWQFLSAHVDAD
jgi:hypothetical protein